MLVAANPNQLDYLNHLKEAYESLELLLERLDFSQGYEGKLPMYRKALHKEKINR